MHGKTETCARFVVSTVHKLVVYVMISPFLQLKSNFGGTSLMTVDKSKRTWDY